MSHIGGLDMLHRQIPMLLGYDAIGHPSPFYLLLLLFISLLLLYLLILYLYTTFKLSVDDIVVCLSFITYTPAGLTTWDELSHYSLFGISCKRITQSCYKSFYFMRIFGNVCENGLENVRVW